MCYGDVELWPAEFLDGLFGDGAIAIVIVIVVVPVSAHGDDDLPRM